VAYLCAARMCVHAIIRVARRVGAHSEQHPVAHSKATAIGKSCFLACQQRAAGGGADPGI
jgi:hypothetical protein